MIIPKYHQAHGLPETFCGHCRASSTITPLFEVSTITGRSNIDEPAPTHLCHPCWDEAYDAKTMQDIVRPAISFKELQCSLEAIVEDFLRFHGMSSEPLLADPDEVPAPFARSLVRPVRKSIDRLKAGHIPATGVCLAGTPDVGKTMTVASWCIQWAANHLRLQIPREIYWQKRMTYSKYRKPHSIFSWVNWIDKYAEWSHGDTANGSVNDLGSVPLLVIDDLGAEEPQKISGKDAGSGRLDRLFAMRDRNNLATLITTNKTDKEIFQRYGERTARRIFRLNPHVLVKDLPLMGRINHVK